MNGTTSRKCGHSARVPHFWEPLCKAMITRRTAARTLQEKVAYKFHVLTGVTVCINRLYKVTCGKATGDAGTVAWRVSGRGMASMRASMACRQRSASSTWRERIPGRGRACV